MKERGFTRRKAKQKQSTWQGSCAEVASAVLAKAAVKAAKVPPKGGKVALALEAVTGACN